MKQRHPDPAISYAWRRLQSDFLPAVPSTELYSKALIKHVFYCGAAAIFEQASTEMDTALARVPSIMRGQVNERCAVLIALFAAWDRELKEHTENFERKGNTP